MTWRKVSLPIPIPWKTLAGPHPGSGMIPSPGLALGTALVSLYQIAQHILEGRFHRIISLVLEVFGGLAGMFQHDGSTLFHPSVLLSGHL